jgi:acylphosphatase
LKIHGRVQGVGFRWWTRQQAGRLGVSGTVRNCRDGTVEAVLVGPEEAVRRMDGLLRDGPPGARVERVDELSEPDGIYDGFRIVR